MPGYTLLNTMAGSLQALTTTYKSLLRPIAAASNPARIRIELLEWSPVSVPSATECQIQADLTFADATASGTSTPGTPMPNDSGTAIGTKIDTARCTAGLNYSVEPTTFTQAQQWFNRGFNQRSSGITWEPAPGREVILPATASVGAAMRALSTNYVGNVVAREVFDEL